MSAKTKRKLATATYEVVNDLLIMWQEGFGRGDVEIKDCGAMIDALLDLRSVASEWADTQVKTTA